jgi:hypothetical protein
MPDQDKPYRVYRGGRAKGRVPLTRHEAKGRSDASARAKPSPGKRRRVGRWIVLALVLLLVLVVAWGVGSYLAIASGGEEANGRVPAGVRKQLTKSDGLLVSNPTTILVLGSDGGNRAGREDANRSDSIMLLRTDPGKRRFSYLSIPRDLQVEIPDVGFEDRGHVPLRHHQAMPGKQRSMIQKRQRVFVLMNYYSRCAPRHNTAKQTGVISHRAPIPLSCLPETSFSLPHPESRQSQV